MIRMLRRFWAALHPRSRAVYSNTAALLLVLWVHKALAGAPVPASPELIVLLIWLLSWMDEERPQ